MLNILGSIAYKKVSLAKRSTNDFESARNLFTIKIIFFSFQFSFFLRLVPFSWSTCVWSSSRLNLAKRKNEKWKECVRSELASHHHQPSLQAPTTRNQRLAMLRLWNISDISTAASNAEWLRSYDCISMHNITGLRCCYDSDLHLSMSQHFYYILETFSLGILKASFRKRLFGDDRVILRETIKVKRS